MELFEKAIGYLPKSSSIRQSYELRNLLQNSGLGVKQAKSMSVKLLEQSRQLTRKDMKQWRDAWETALDVEKPQRSDLYDIYDDAMVDLHLYGAIRNRMLKNLSRKFKVVEENGEENEEATKALTKKWFRKFCLLALESKFYGHSLIQFGDIIEGKFSDVKLVPRRHVIPEFGIIVRETGDETGYDYRSGTLAQWVIEVGESDDLGILLKLSKEAISKKNVIQFWDEFAEIFGIPIRVAKTSTRDKKDLARLENMMKNMGSALYSLLPTGTDIEIKEASKGDAFNVFDKRIDRANSEMSKGVNGQTMTMDNGSSRSQAEVHQDVSDVIVESDGVDLSYAINDDLIPFLIKKGFPFKEGDNFVFDNTQELSMKDQLEIDQWLVSNFEIDLNYFKEKYNSEITAFKEVQPFAMPIGGGAVGK